MRTKNTCLAVREQKVQLTHVRQVFFCYQICTESLGLNCRKRRNAR